MTGKTRLHVLLSLVGILGLIASLALAAGTMRPTEATWQDTVLGESQFGTDENVGQNYARALSSYGTMTRSVSGSENRGPTRAALRSTDTLARIEAPLDEESSPFGRAVLPVSTAARSCVRTMVLPEGCIPEPQDPPTTYAVAEFHSLDIHALRLVGIPTTRLAIYDADEPIRATASCTPGADGVARVTAGGAVGLGGRLLTDRVNVPVPLEPGISPLVTREWGAYNYQARIFHDRVVKKNHAISQVRLVIEATAWSGDGERWALNLILARAECGIAMQMPPDPPRPAAPTAPLNTMTTMRAVAPAALQPITDLAEEELAEAEALDDAALEGTATGEAAETGATAGTDELEPELPSLTDAAQTIEDESHDSAADEGQDPDLVEEDASEAATTTPVASTTSPDTTAPAESDAQATETAPAETSTSTPSTTVPVTTAPETTAPETSETAAPETTEPTEPTSTAEAPPGPQTPQDVTLGRKFALTALDGTDLGTATIEDVQHTADCGVEITLYLTTSDEAGPDRLDSLGPSDFAEVSPSGATRDVQRVTSECEQSANSRTTTLQPGSSTRIVIAFRVTDTATTAMLRPDGTAGWTFPLT